MPDILEEAESRSAKQERERIKKIIKEKRTLIGSLYNGEKLMQVSIEGATSALDEILSVIDKE